MLTIPVTHVEFGDTIERTISRLAVFAAICPPGTAVTECDADPLMFNRELTSNAAIFRPNLLSPAWWRGGSSETSFKTQPAIIPFETKESA